MKIQDIVKRLSKLDPDMDMNDLRECLTTNKNESDELVAMLNDDTDSWDEFSAALTKGAVIPMLLEIRDLMLMPASERGWLKPAEMAKKVAEQVEINEAKCQMRISELQASFGEAEAYTENEHRAAVAKLTTAQDEQIAELRQRHNLTIEDIERRHETAVDSLKEDHRYESEMFEEQIGTASQQSRELREKLAEAKTAIPGQQASAVAKVLTDASDRVEAMAQMRLARLVKRKGIFREKDFDQTMLRVEADGILVAAKRLRQMASEAEEQGVWPVEFASGEEDTPEAKEALARMLAPIRKAEPVADAAEEETMEPLAEVEAD